MVWTEEEILAACLSGNQDAWSSLIEKYKRLIYSIPVRYGIPHEDAEEIFQQVCLSLSTELGSIRDPKSLSSWLIRVTLNKCHEWARRRRSAEEPQSDIERSFAVSPDDLLLEAERGRILDEALDELNDRCRQLVEMLFYDTPPLPYEEVAKRLNLARGSIGFTRMRCLERLRLLLQKKGFR